MKRIFIDGDLTTELKNNHKTEALNNSSIALLNATFVVKYFNLEKDATMLIMTNDNKPVSRLSFKAGFWSSKTIKNSFNASSKGIVTLDELTNGKLWLRIANGYKVAVPEALSNLVGLTYDPSQKYLAKNEYFMVPNF